MHNGFFVQCHVLMPSIMAASTNDNSPAGSQKGLAGYCFKYIDRPFCLRTNELI